MPKALSAIFTSGWCRRLRRRRGRAAAARFGVRASSAVRWCARLRATGSVVPGALGGDRRSGRTQAHAARILELWPTTLDLTLAELRAVLAEGGSTFALRRHYARLVTR